VAEDAVVRYPETLLDGLDDPLVGLVRDEPVEVGNGATARLERLQRRHGNRLDGETEHLVAVHCDVRPAGVDRLVARGLPRSAGGDLEQVSPGPVSPESDSEYSGLLGGLEDDGTRTVPEEHTRGAVGEVDVPGEGIGPHHRHPPGTSGLDRRGARLQCVDEPEHAAFTS
jgi:hypothetical protein